MVSTYTSINRFTLQGTGDNASTWGDVANNGVFKLVEDALDGLLDIDATGGSSITLTTGNGVTDQARIRRLRITGTPTSNISVFVPNVNKYYFVEAATSGSYTVTVAPTGGTGVTLTNPYKNLISVNTSLAFEAVTIPATTSPFTTGELKAFYLTTAPSGWIAMSGLTIGNAISGATGRANADTQNLFTVLWDNDPNLTVSGGRGSSASSDYALNKTITLPDFRGRVPVGLDNMGGSTAGRITSAGSGITGTTLGATGGAEVHTLTTPQMPNHTHTASVTDPGHTHGLYGLEVTIPSAGPNHVAYYDTAGGSSGPKGGTFSATTGISVSISSTGGGGSHNNTQPSGMVLWCLRL